MGGALMAKSTTTHLIKRMQHQVDSVNQSRHSALGKQKRPNKSKLLDRLRKWHIRSLCRTVGWAAA
tara:strand:+ start:325 stop:522 length:198 start_codon:yes stop_codon:yes gene_type:complete